MEKTKSNTEDNRANKKMVNYFTLFNGDKDEFEILYSFCIKDIRLIAYSIIIPIREVNKIQEMKKTWSHVHAII